MQRLIKPPLTTEMTRVSASDWPVVVTAVTYVPSQYWLGFLFFLFSEWKNDATSALECIWCGQFLLFLSCSTINSGECCCLSYFMCHWLPQSQVKNAHHIYKASSCLPLHSLALLHSPDNHSPRSSPCSKTRSDSPFFKQQGLQEKVKHFESH